MVSTLAWLHPPHTPGEARGTATAPSGNSFILFQIRTSPIGVHPLDLCIGVHPVPAGRASARLPALAEGAR